MTDKQTPPDWVLIEAAKRSGWDFTLEWLRDEYDYVNTAFHALCDTIERYEQPPMDRKVLCAHEAVLTAGDGWTRADVAVRAIELWESGYGV